MGELTDLLATLDAQPPAVQERFLRRSVEAWLVHQREVYNADHPRRKARILDGRQAVLLEDVVLAQAFQLEALMNVLERQGLLRKAEVLEEIKQLREKSVKAR